MTERILTDELFTAIESASKHAYMLGHKTLTNEHILHALMEDKQVQSILHAIHVDPAALQEELDTHLKSIKPENPGQNMSLSYQTVLSMRTEKDEQLSTLDMFEHLLEKAKPDSLTQYLIEKYGVQPSIVREAIAHTPTSDGAAPDLQAYAAEQAKALNSPFHPDFERNQLEKILNLEDELKQKVMGQDEACHTLGEAFIIAAGEDVPEEKPIGSFLFNGPTGTGKTEVTKQLAKILGRELIRIDMSEYSEAHAAARLVGSPPGYVGYDQGGQLTNAVKENPNAIILLDEVEKAHPKAHQILLQVMDAGRLTDGQGNQVDFSKSVLIMTGNIGITESKKNQIGFMQDSTEQQIYHDQLKQTFAPEFLNRLDAVVQFNALTPDIMEKILDKMVGQLNGRYNNTQFEFSEAARADLVERGFDPEMGARPLERLLKKDVAAPASKEILQAKIAHQTVSKVRVDFDAAAGELTFAYETESAQKAAVEQDNNQQYYQYGQAAAPLGISGPK